MARGAASGYTSDSVGASTTELGPAVSFAAHKAKGADAVVRGHVLLHGDSFLFLFLFVFVPPGNELLADQLLFRAVSTLRAN